MTHDASVLCAMHSREGPLVPTSGYQGTPHFRALTNDRFEWAAWRAAQADGWLSIR